MDNLLRELDETALRWPTDVTCQLCAKAARRIRDLEARLHLYESGQLGPVTYLTEQQNQERFDG